MKIPRYVKYYGLYGGENNELTEDPLYGKVLGYGPTGTFGRGDDSLVYLKVQFLGKERVGSVPYVMPGAKNIEMSCKTIEISEAEYNAVLVLTS